MVISLRLALIGAQGETSGRDILKQRRHPVDVEPIPLVLNGAKTSAAERVHLGEIIVIPGD
jgi:hypothetical protein